MRCQMHRMLSVARNMRRSSATKEEGSRKNKKKKKKDQERVHRSLWRFIITSKNCTAILRTLVLGTLSGKNGLKLIKVIGNAWRTLKAWWKPMPKGEIDHCMSIGYHRKITVMKKKVIPSLKIQRVNAIIIRDTKKRVMMTTMMRRMKKKNRLVRAMISIGRQSANTITMWLRTPIKSPSTSKSRKPSRKGNKTLWREWPKKNDRS